MGLLGSVFGATVGWWTLGPIGLIMGLVLGHMAEESVTIKKLDEGDISSRHAKGGFLASLLILMAAVMKADGKVVKSELDMVKQYLVQNLGEEQASEALILLRDILKQNISIPEVCHQIRINLEYAYRLELVHFLFRLGNADNALSSSEVRVIIQVASGLGLSANDISAIQNLYINDIESVYKVLEISPDFTDEEIKKAYRSMAIRFHPDKVEHLGEEFKKSANEKFQKVNEAFERIKKDRGMK